MFLVMLRVIIHHNSLLLSFSTVLKSSFFFFLLDLKSPTLFIFHSNSTLNFTFSLFSFTVSELDLKSLSELLGGLLMNVITSGELFR